MNEREGTMREDGSEMMETVRIGNRDGLHARPAAEFVKLASTFDSEIWVEKDGLEVNGKSIMGVLMLAAEPGSRIRIRAVGPDSADAVSQLLELVEGGFGEEPAEDPVERGPGTPS